MAPLTSLIPRRNRRQAGLLFALFLVALGWYTIANLGSLSDLNFIAKPLRPELYPVPKLLRLPRQRSQKIPKIQHAPVIETLAEKKLRQSRLKEVRETFLHAWNGYKQEAWGRDEMRPISGSYHSPFCGWAATLVDSLDTLLIMGLDTEFELALEQLPHIDFTNTEGCQINLFETTIRHLGGLLSAHDLTKIKRPILIEKAVELAEVLFTAFDTPNRMPSPHYLWSALDPTANNHLPSKSVVVAVLGSLSLEFTRLSQITGNEKYYDGIQRVMNELEKWQPETQLPGMWPAMVDSSFVNETIALGSPFPGSDETFTLGALADSTYEYLPKTYMLLGGQKKAYRTMYESFIPVAKENLFFRPMTVGDHDILISGVVTKSAGTDARLNPTLEHLTCFTGGMLAIAGKIFNRPEDVIDGKKLTDGCVWAYRSTITGIMPETFTAIPCESREKCEWDEEKWYEAVDKWSGQPSNGNKELIREKIQSQQLSPGYAFVNDGRYLLRPEAIESVFIMWRISADPFYPTAGWDMFKSIQAHCKTPLAHSAIESVLGASPKKVDEMESFWLAETLKYFYLLYSESHVVNLDEYVLNTEAHPLKRPI